MSRRPRALLASVCAAVVAALVATAAWCAPPAWSSARPSAEPLLLARVPLSSTIYVVASGQCMSASCLELLRTSVTAGRFTHATLPPIGPQSGSATGTLSDLAFASANVGFAVLDAAGSPRLYATSDGARSWHRWALRVPGIVESVAVTGDTLYLEMAFCAVTVPYCDNFRVARTPLNAPHWSSTAIPGSDTAAEGSFFGPLTAYGSQVWVTETGSRAFVAHSLDRGHHFSLVASPQLLSVTGCALTATSPTDLWAQCSTGMQEAFWFTSNDLKSWTYLDTPRPVFGTGGGRFDPVSASLAYLAGGASFASLLRVTNGARDVTNAGRLVCPNLLGLTFTDVDHGLAVCSSYSTSDLKRTSDGGATWHEVAVPSP